MKVSNAPFLPELKEYHIFDFGEVYFFENYIITEFFEGANLTFKHAQEFIVHAEAYYGNLKEVIYISNRINSYSVKALDWLKISNKYSNLRAVCIVCPRKQCKLNFFIEKQFCRQKMELFNELEQAVNWAESYLDSHKVSA